MEKNKTTMSEEEWKKRFPNQLFYLMQLNGMTQRDLSRKMNMTEASISRYINGERIPKANVLFSMAKALNCHVSWLLEFDELQKDKAVKLYELRKRLEDLSINMTFGEAIEALRSGHTVTRKAWNKDGEDTTYISMIAIKIGDKITDTICASRSLIILHDIINPNWLASTDDILANDWYIVK